MRTVRTPSVASGQGCCVQTAHLESWCIRPFRSKALQVMGSGRTVISSTSTGLYVDVHLDALLSSPTGVWDVEIL